MIRLDSLVCEGSREIELHLGPGELGVIPVRTAREADSLLEVLCGFRRRRRGRIELLGTDPRALPQELQLEFLRHVGISWTEGAVVSNLSILDNLLLPLRYHEERSKHPLDDDLETVIDLLRRSGPVGEQLEQELHESAGHLPANQQRIVGLLRSLLHRPELILCATPLAGLAGEDRAALADLLRAYPAADPARSVLALVVDPRDTELLRRPPETVS